MKSVKRLALVLLVLALLAAMLPTALAAQTAVVYVKDGGTGDGSTPETPAGTLEDAYKTLISSTDIEEEETTTQGVIVLVGPTTLSSNFNIPGSGKAVNSHVGKLTITGCYDSVDYGQTASAALINGRSEDLYIQMGGPTVMENLKLNTDAYPMRIYGGEDFTLGSGITVTKQANLTVHGGWCRVETTADVKITILSGKVGIVSSATYGKSHSSVEGSCAITIGGTAEVTTVWAGAAQSKNSDKVQDTANVTVTVNSGAKVGTYHAGGANGNLSASTLVLAGGTVDTISRGTGVTSANITLSGVTDSAYTLPEGTWDSFTVTGGSEVTMAAVLPEGIKLVVNQNSKLTLCAGDAAAYTGDGTETVIYSHAHNWVADTTKTNIPSTCTTHGTAYYKCDIANCSETKSVTLPLSHQLTGGACTLCGGSVNVVYVKDGGTGDGFTAATAVGSLEAAYEALITNTAIEEDASVKGTIVICGKIARSDSFNFENDGSCSHKGTVTLTSVYGGVDYRKSGAELHLASQDTGTSATAGTSCEQRFQVGGPTVMENLTINRAGSKQPLTIYAGTYLYIGETVKTLDTKFTYVPATADIPVLTDEQIASIQLSAHRGYQPMGPENTVLSFTAAGELGFAYIETDVYMTAKSDTEESVLICLHDSTLKRTANDDSGTNVTSMTYSEILKYRIDTAKYGFDITKADEKDLYVPTFRQYLEICKKYGCKPFIEIKDSREDTIHATIDMALEYFDAEDIVMSCGSMDPLKAAHAYNKDVFIHKIWGSESEIAELAQMKNSKGEVYAGIAFNIENLHLEANYNEAKRLIEKSNAAGLQTCLRAADDLTQARLMYELGINYYPTNKTTPEMLKQLKATVTGTPADYVSNGQSTKGTNDHRIFIRGGYNSGTTTEDISITLLGGQYDLAAPSNGEKASTGSYSMVVGGDAYVSRLVLGETGGSVAADREKSTLTVQGDAIIANLYLAGDKANVKDVTVSINGGRVKAVSSKRGGSGTAGNVTMNLKDISLMPGSVGLDSSVLTLTKVLAMGGTGSLGDSAQWDKLVAKDGAVITLTGTYPNALAREGTGKFLVNDQSFTFGTIEKIKEDDKAVTLESDIAYTFNGSGTLNVTWYADENGVRGAALSGAPKAAGTYWVGVAVAEAATNNEALYHAAVAEQYASFTIVHDLTEVAAKAPTCTADGTLKHYTCAGCDTIFADAEGKTVLTSIVDKAIGHAFTTYTANGDASCTADGTKTAVCGHGCGEKDTVADPGSKLGHKLVKTEAKAATADAEGNIAYYTCERCGKLYTDETAVKEITKADTVIAKLGSSESPKTGESIDTGMTLCVMAVSLLAFCVVIKKRRA